MQHLSLKILQTLHQEHQAVMSLLERLEALLGQHGVGDVPPADDEALTGILGDLAASMKNEIGHHYALEEGHLFPLFSQRMDPGIPMMLKSEHEAIRPVAESITEVAEEALNSGFTEATWTRFHALGMELVEREIFHVQKEEMGFLPNLEQLISPTEDDDLVAAYEKIKNG